MKIHDNEVRIRPDLTRNHNAPISCYSMQMLTSYGSLASNNLVQHSSNQLQHLEMSEIWCLMSVCYLYVVDSTTLMCLIPLVHIKKTSEIKSIKYRNSKKCIGLLKVSWPEDAILEWHYTCILCLFFWYTCLLSLLPYVAACVLFIKEERG